MIHALSLVCSRFLTSDTPMPVDYIRYDVLAQAALRGVVRTVLADVAKKGLPGEHHFKITFATAAPGVRLSERMRGQYPDAMTIVLQHQFWDLTVDDDGFEVGLSFGGIPERLAVPFDAVTAFFDPAVQFGFQFESLDKQAAEEPSTAAEAPAPRPAAIEKTDALPVHAVPAEPAPNEKSGGAEVVRLDRFRKK
jgi:uncharacterized protein